MDNMELQRLEFLKELKQRKVLREAVRKAIRIALDKRDAKALNEELDEMQRLEEEAVLRGYLREYIKESVATQDQDPSPHRSTGINVLSDLLKKIIPILEDDYKILTTDSEQRQSFRAHIIHGVKNALAPLQATDDVGPDSDATNQLEEDLGVTVGADEPAADDERFIDIADADADAEELSPEEEFATGLDGQDLTGRNMAYSSFKKIERNILDAYELLSNDEDRELFYDYLITNLKLYFDKFEDELAGNLEEPTTPEYEDAAAEAGDMDGGEPEDDFAPAEEDPAMGDEELTEKWYTARLSSGGGTSTARVKGPKKDQNVNWGSMSKRFEILKNIPLQIKLIATMTLFDLLMTLGWVQSGNAHEANPILEYALQAGVIYFTLAKLIMGLGSLWIFYKHQYHSLVKRVMPIVFIFYILLTLLHLYGLVYYLIYLSQLS